MKGTLSNIPSLPDQLVIGQIYLRPCVRTKWLIAEPSWIPVIGSIHSDPEHVKADFEHIHTDYRFLPTAIREQVEDDLQKSNKIFNIHPVYVTPISQVWPENYEQMAEIEAVIAAGVPENTWLKIQPCEYLGPYPSYPVHLTPWIKELSKAHAGDKLIDGKICTHQGTDLSGIAPDSNGVITCPLHGLTWSARTKKIVMPPGTC